MTNALARRAGDAGARACPDDAAPGERPRLRAAASLSVGLDGRLVGRGLGVATYVRELAQRLLERPDIRRIVWFGTTETAPDHPKVVVCDLGGRPFGLLDSALGRRLVAAHDVDVMHFAANTGWTSHGPVPMVVTLHDLIFLERGGRGATLRQRAGRRYMRWNVPRACRLADQVIAVSHDTAAAVAAQPWASGRRPPVIHHGVEVPDGAMAVGERRDFVVFGAADPRKNLALAIDAFEDAAPLLPRGTTLHVLAGAGLDDRLRRRMEACSGLVTMHGYLDRDELLGRLARSVALVHPTIAEGFGLPVLDAMAVGTPVIGGLTAAGRELAGPAMVSLDLADPRGSLGQAMVRLATDPGLARHLAALGRHRAASFSWERCAADHSAVYRHAVAA